MEFKSLSVIKHPAEKVWLTMRDHLHEITEFVEDVESIKVQNRMSEPDGLIKVVNIWTASPKLPSFVVDKIKPNMLMWTDTAMWDESKLACNWEIDSHYFKEKMSCLGTTTFESAIGGRGCRLMFRGEIHFEGRIITSGRFDGMISKTVENVIGKVIPNNFRKVTHAVGSLIERKSL